MSGANRLQAKRSIANVGDGNMMKKTKAVLGMEKDKGCHYRQDGQGRASLRGSSVHRDMHEGTIIISQRSTRG